MIEANEMLSQLQACEEKHGKVTEDLLREDQEYINPYYIKKEFGTLSEAKLLADLDDPGQIHLTDEKLSEIDTQVRTNSHTREVITGLLMGDAWIHEDPGKDGSALSIEMTNEKFLNWIKDELGDLVSYVKLKATGEELAEKNRSFGYTVHEENYSDLYILRSRRVPALEEFRAWYDTGQKVFPNDLELTPLILKMWYCCDGSYNTTNHSAVIYLKNEVNRPAFLSDLFNSIGFDVAVGTQQVHFTVDQTQQLLDYIGEAPPGFNYKWGPE